MKKRYIAAILSLCIASITAVPVYAADGNRTVISSDPTSEDGYKSTTETKTGTSNEKPSEESPTAQNSSEQAAASPTTATQQDGTKKTVQYVTKGPSYVKDGRYYNTWAGRSNSLSNGFSKFGQNAYNYNSWNTRSIVPTGRTGFRSLEWDSQLGYDPTWNNDPVPNNRYVNNYDNSYRSKRRDDDSNKNSSSNSTGAPNVLTYDQVYGSSSSTKNSASSILQKATGIVSSATSTSGRAVTINQSVADQATEEQRNAEKAQKGNDRPIVATSGYSYVNILGAVTPAEYNQFEAYLKQIITNDPAMIDTFKNNNWKIVLTTADLDKLLYDGETENVKGCTVANKKAIYIEVGDSSYCIIHEMGHFLDAMAGTTSQSASFKKIYEEEGTKLSSYGASDVEEFFAEAYNYFITDSSYLKNNAPKTYEYLVDIRKAVTGV